MRYEDFNYNIGNEGFITDVFKKLFGKKKEDAPKKSGVKIARSELRSILNSIDSGLEKDCRALLKSVESKHSEFFKTSPEAITFSHNYKESVSGEWDNCIAVFYYDMNEINTSNGKGMARSIFRDELPVGDEVMNIMNELMNGLKPLVDKYFSDNLIKKGIKVSADSLGDWDDGDLGFYFENIDVVDNAEGTEDLKNIVKQVAIKAADRAGMIPSGRININKSNIREFARSCSILEKYGQNEYLLNKGLESFDDIKVNPTNSSFYVNQGWLIYDLTSVKGTENVENALNRLNYLAIKVIKSTFENRGIEVHPNPIKSRNGLMYKLGKVGIEDGVYSVSELINNLRYIIGVESFDESADVFDLSELEYGIEEFNDEFNLCNMIGIESDMISIFNTFGDIDEISEMIAIESENLKYLDSFAGLENEINDIINTISNLEISLESFEEGTEGFAEIKDELVKQGKRLVKAILKFFNIGLTLSEQGRKTAEIVTKVARKAVRELKLLPNKAREDFVFNTGVITPIQFYMNKVVANYNKTIPFIGMAEEINRTYNRKGRKFTDEDIIDFQRRFDGIKFTYTVPQETADVMYLKSKLNYNETVETFGFYMGGRGIHSYMKCPSDVAATINILNKEINNLSYSKELIDALKSWLKKIQDSIKPYRTMLINVGRAAKGVGKEVAKAMAKAKAKVGIESVVGLEARSVKDYDPSQDIVDEILDRMEQDPLLKLAKDKEFIVVSVNPKEKRKISINFKEIREIEKVLTPEDIQKYGGSTYQLLLKLSDTFNKNIMWNMKEIEEAAKSRGTNIDSESLESMRGREYYIAIGIESLDDFIDEILFEVGNEDFAEIAASTKEWFKKMIAKIIDMLGKDRIVHSFQRRNLDDIKKKVMGISQFEMDKYDLYTIQGVMNAFVTLNKNKTYFYNGLNKINFSDPNLNIKNLIRRLDSSGKKVRDCINDLEKLDKAFNADRPSGKSSSKGTLNTIKATFAKIRFDYIDVRQNFLKLEKIIESGNLDQTDLDALKEFLKISKSMQAAYLRGSTRAFRILRKLVYEPNNRISSNESVKIVLCCNTNIIETYGLEDAKTNQFKQLVKIAAIFTLGLTVIPLTFKAIWNQTPWGKKKLAEKVKREAEEQENNKKAAEQKLRVERESEETKKVYKEIVGKSIKDIAKVSQSVHKMMSKMPEFNKFIAELEEKSKSDQHIKNFKSDILWFCSDDDWVEDYGDGISAFNFSQDVYLIDEWKNLESALLRELNKQSSKIYCKPGYEWKFVEPFDDESCFWCILEKSDSEGTEGIIDTIKQKWKDGVEKQKTKRDSWDKAYYQREREKNRSTAQKIVTRKELKELKAKSVETAKLILGEIKNYIKDNGLEYIKFKEPSKREGHLNNIDRGENGAYSWELWIGHVNTDKFKSFDDGGDYDKFNKFVDRTINKYKDQLGFELDRWEIDAQTILVFMKSHFYVENSKSGNESFNIGEEGIIDTIKEKWKGFRSKQNTDKIIKILSSTAELDKLKSECTDVVKSIYDEVKSELSKSNLNFIELNPFDKNDAINVIKEGENYQLEFHFLYYSTSKWSKDNHNEVFEQEETFRDIIESVINKHKDEFGFPIEYNGTDDGMAWGLSDGYIKVSESQSVESEIVKAIHDEFGLEGITSVIKRITSSK